MNVKLTGAVDLEFEVDIKQCIKALGRKLGYNENYFIKDNCLYESIDVGYHKSEYEDVLKSKDIYDVELFKAYKILEKHFS